MKFRFEDQPHQASAISAVTDLFENALQADAGLFGVSTGTDGHARFELDHEALRLNLVEVTGREAVPVQNQLELLSTTDLEGGVRAFPNFSVEMETGTGKTFVYIATALRLAELHGLRKFIILVHSVAIRAGVVKTFEQTADFFRLKSPSLNYRWGVLGEGPALDDFLEPSESVQFLVVSVQAIDKPESNAIYQSPEQPQLWSEAQTGIGGIAAARPVVMIDEPQNMTTERRRRAIATLNPLFVLRYSATHKEAFNLVHRLGPKAASDMGLVKRVSVRGVVAAGSGPYLRLKKIKTVNKRLMMDAVMDRRSPSGTERVNVVLQNGMDLFEESGGLDEYRGLVVDRLERKPDRLFFESGRQMGAGEEVGIDRDAVWRDQIRHTIRQHLARQAQTDGGARPVKVLSLFFVDRVSDYVGPDAPLPTMFDILFREEWLRAGRAESDCPAPHELRTAYFPSTKTGILKDTTNLATEADLEARAYLEIVKTKELLLVRENPRAFIFSHSALKEGWDNPNVFQVCFLRHTRSDLERRQQIGRGLRLPVDETGVRVLDPAICRLTLIVDEAFTAFRDGLNAEYEAAGLAPSDAGPTPDDAAQEIIVRRRPELFDSPAFAEMWDRIRFKARYRVTIDPAALPPAVAASELLEEAEYIALRANVVETAELEYDDDGLVITADNAVVEGQGERADLIGKRLPDLARLVEDHLLSAKYPLQLTRPTLRAILAALPAQVCRHAVQDPGRWARIVAEAIRVVTIEEMVKQIVYEPTEEEDWWAADVVFVEAETVNPPEVQLGGEPNRGVVASTPGGANLFDHLVFDSQVELNFAAQLENASDHVPLFAKLPRRFRVRTPVGEYSPDWAIVFDQPGHERLILVRETKDKLALKDLTWDEAMRIRFARRHFEARASSPVDYNHTTDTAGLRVALELRGET